MSLPPVEIPLGAMRFNSDSQRLEYFNGDKWFQVHTVTDLGSSGDPERGPRAIHGCGYTPSGTDDEMDYNNIASTGNSVAFGNASANHEHKKGTAASTTRGIWAGGNAPSSQTDSIDYVTISSTGNASDFGNLTSVRNTIAGCGNNIRGIFCNGHDSNSGSPYNSNIINYITIATTGNASDFGDTVNQARDRNGVSVPISGFISGGVTSSGNVNTIEKITINTLGNAVDSGFDVTAGGSGGCSASHALSGRCIFQASGSSPFPIEQFNAYTMSNSYGFGDLPADGQSEGGSPCSPTRALFTCCGSYTNTIAYVTISTMGDATDFGDLTKARSAFGSLSNAHGGIG